MKLVISVLLGALLLPAIGLCQTHFFMLPGAFFYTLNRDTTEMDVNAQGTIAVAVMNAEGDQSQFALLTSFDPTTGNQFDSKLVGFGPAHVRIASTTAGDRVVVLTTEGGPNTVTIFDMAPSGILTERARTRLTDSIVDFRSNIAVSSQDRVGFIIVDRSTGLIERKIIAFSLDDVRILSTLPAGIAFSFIALKEVDGRRILSYVRGFSPSPSLVVVDATDASQPVELGSVPLPLNPGSSLVGSGRVVISSDGRYAFVADPFLKFSAVDLTTMTVVSALDGNYSRELRITEDQSRRLLAVIEFDPMSFASLTLLVINATEPDEMRVENSVELPFRTTDYTFSRSGDLLLVANGEGFKALEVPSLLTVADIPIPSSGDSFSHEVLTYGSRERALASWGIFNALFGSFELPTSFDLCIQDESNGNTLKINSTTGEYEFTTCNGLTVGGIGIITIRGSLLTLQHVASDRRIIARVDSGLNKATVSVQFFSQGATLTITDRNITNNTCACQ